MTNNQLNRERLEKIKSWRETYGAGSNVMLPAEEAEELACLALAAMDSDPVILYRQVNPVNGMKTYWAELDPEEFRHLKQHTDENAEFMTLYRHAQPAQISEPVLPLQDKDLQGVIDALEHHAGINAAGKQVVRHALVELQERRKVERDTEPYGFTDGDRRGMIYKPEHSDRLSEPVPVYRHAQPVPGVPPELTEDMEMEYFLRDDWKGTFRSGWEACRAAMLQENPVCTCPSGDGSLRWPCPVHPGSSPEIPDGYVLVPKEATLDMLKAGAKQEMKGEAFQYVWQAMLAAAPQEVMKDEANNLSPK